MIASPSPFSSVFGRVLAVTLWGLLGPLTGLAQSSGSFKIDNVRGHPIWPDDVRRVAVLPIHDATATLTELPLLHYDQQWVAALQHSQRAEFVMVPREQLRLWHNQRSWHSSMPLPHDYLDRIAESTGAQAVVFVDLTTLLAPTRPTLGFRVKLVRLADANILWITDEVFDLRDPKVAKAARSYAKRQNSRHHREDATITLRQSPAALASFAFFQTVKELPVRIPDAGYWKKN